MLNVLRPTMTRLFTPVGRALVRTPITPNAITVIGTVGVAGAALSLFPLGELFPGAFTCTIFVFLDMLDGVLARMKGTTGTWGAFLDSTMDRIADAGIFGGLVVWFSAGTTRCSPGCACSAWSPGAWCPTRRLGRRDWGCAVTWV